MYARTHGEQFQDSYLHLLGFGQSHQSKATMIMAEGHASINIIEIWSIRFSLNRCVFYANTHVAGTLIP